MTRHLYRLASGLQELLLEAAMLRPPDEWARHVPRLALDAWATLWRWLSTGERVWRITDRVTPLDPALPLATAPATTEAVAVQMPDRSDWIVIARHTPAPAYIPVSDGVGWAYAQPVLTCCSPGSGRTPESMGSGYINLIEQPTPADISLIAGTISDMDGRSMPLRAGHLHHDAIRLYYALAALYTT